MSKLPDYILKHIASYQSDPESAHDWDTTQVGGPGPVPTLLLTTTGRQTGEPRPTPLLYQPCGTGFIVVASQRGARKNPAWYRNLVADPACSLQVGRFRYSANARILSGDERSRYWDWMTRFWPLYNDYQSRTQREIPVVILDATPV